MTQANFIQITPFLHVPNLEQGISFFRDILGFQLLIQMDVYAYLERESVGIRMMEQGDENAEVQGNRRFAYYIDVIDVDALYEELKPKLEKLPPKDVHGPMDKPYGQRELLILAPDGNLIAFGQSLTDFWKRAK